MAQRYHRGHHHESVDKRCGETSADYKTNKRHRSSDEGQHGAAETLSAHRQLYERHFPLYKQPVEVGCFSLDSRRSFFNDHRQLRYYVQPTKSPGFNLRDGYTSRFVKRDDSVKEKLDHVLKWILANRDKIQTRVQPPSSRSETPSAPFYSSVKKQLLTNK